jgi:uncharacterized membrane protein YcjF (UPF0283 family)
MLGTVIACALTAKIDTDDSATEASDDAAERWSFVEYNVREIIKWASGGEMKNINAALPLLLASAATLAGCQIVGDIFKAGVWVGVIAVVAVIALVIWLVTRLVS